MRPTYEQLEQTVLAQEQTICKLQARIEKLEARLNKNSRNSSKPPSSDQKGNIVKKKSSKNEGAPHAGVSRQLLPPDMVTSREVRAINTCPRCQSEMKPTGESVKWQQVELPKIKPLVHEIELLTCKCVECSLIQVPILADHETFLMGPRLEGFVNVLMGQFRHSHLGVRNFIQMLIPQLQLSQGLISKVKKRAAQAFDQAASQLEGQILASLGPKFADTTGWRHKAKNWNILILRNSILIRYFLIEKQNGAVLAEILKQGPHFLVSDRGLAIQKIKLRHLQYCLAHLLRNLRGMAEKLSVSLEETQILGEIYETLQKLFHYRHRYERAEIGKATWRQHGYKSWAWMRQKFEELLSNSTLDTLKRFCKRVLADWKYFMVYLAQDGPMTNNLAEEGLRNFVIARKLCFGSQSNYGLKWREVVQSCIETLKRQGKSVIDFFAETIQAFRTKSPCPRIV